MRNQQKRLDNTELVILSSVGAMVITLSATAMTDEENKHNSLTANIETFAKTALPILFVIINSIKIAKEYLKKNNSTNTVGKTQYSSLAQATKKVARSASTTYLAATFFQAVNLPLLENPLMVAAGFQILQDEKSHLCEMVAATLFISSKLFAFASSNVNPQQANRTDIASHAAEDSEGPLISNLLLLAAGISLFFGALISMASHNSTDTAATAAQQHSSEGFVSEYGTASSTTAALLNNDIEQPQQRRISF